MPIRPSAKAIIIQHNALLAIKKRDRKGDYYILPGGGQMVKLFMTRFGANAKRKSVRRWMWAICSLCETTSAKTMSSQMMRWSVKPTP